MEEEKKPEIWTPAEKLDANVQRMAWLLFLECWKAHLAQPELCIGEGWKPEYIYDICLKNAKVVRVLEQAPQ